MRIVHITTVHPAGDARIFYRMCQPLAEKGLSVGLIAPGEAPVVEGPRVMSSSWNGKIAQAGRIERIRLALRAALAEDANVYHFHDPELIPLGLAVKMVRPAASVVYDVHEDYPAMMREKYWIPKPLRGLVSWAVHYANTVAGLCVDGIVTADPSVQGDFVRSARQKAIVYYNFPTLSLFEPVREGDERTEAKADLVYIGGMSDRAGTFVLLDALVLLCKRGLRPSVKLAGYTDGTEGWLAVQNGIQARGLKAQVELCGRIPFCQVPAWIRMGRIGLVTLQPIAKFMKNIPSKMFEYWACGLPAIASDLPPIRQFLLDGKNGLIFDPSSPVDLARAIRYLLDHPAEVKTMGNFARELVYDNWNVDRQIEDLIRFYEGIHSS